MILLELFMVFAKIGLFSFGGGYAMISLLQQEAVSRGYMTVSEFSDIVAISQITPGPIAVNMATFVGYRQAGIPGSLLATLGVSLPSFLIVLLVVGVIAKFNESRAVRNVFFGLRPAVAGLICAAVVQIARPEFLPDTLPAGFSEILPAVKWRSVGIALAAFLCIRIGKISPIPVILGAAVVGAVVFS